MMHTRIAQKQLLMHSRALLASAFFGLLLFPTVTFGFGEVKITEINYRGYTDWSDESESNASDEFITLENTTGALVNLEGVTLRVISGSSDKMIELGGEISDTLQIRKITRSQEENPMIPGTWHSGDIPSLHNTNGAYLELRNSEGVTVDSVNLFGVWPVSTDIGQKLVRTAENSWEIAPLTPENGEEVSDNDSTSPENKQEDDTNYSNLLILSEFLPNPVGADSEGEFVEIYNKSNQSVSLEGWKLDDIIDTGSSPMTLSGSVPAGSWYVIAKPDLSISLNNSGDGIDSVRLIDPNDTTQDEISYQLNEVKEGVSYSLVEGNWYWTSQVTPGVKNVSDLIQIDNEEVPDDTDSISDIPANTVKISEVYPYPIGGSEEEFIELFNTQIQPISLEGWAIGDLGKTVPLNGYIPARSYRVLSFLETRIYLNNSGETVMLFEPNQTLHDQVRIPKAERGLSFIPIGNTWDWTTTLTRGFSNQFTRNSVGGGREADDEDEDYRVLDSLDATTDLEDDQLIQVSGWIVSPRDDFLSRSLYLTDGNRTIRIRLAKDDPSSFSLNQRLQVTGSWHISDTQAYLNVDGYLELPLGDVPAIQPAQSFDADNWGRSITLRGELLEQSGTRLVVAYQGQEFPVRLAKSIEKPDMTKGDQVQVTGILEWYRNELRVLVMDQSGIQSLESPETTDPKDTTETVDQVLSSDPKTTYEYISWDTFDQPGTLVEESESFLMRMQSWIQWMPWQLRESRSFLLALGANGTWWMLLALRALIRR